MSITNTENLLEIKNISKKYEDKVILDNISLELKKGEVLGLIGHTGCGKTTLMRIINSIESPDINNKTNTKKTAKITVNPSENNAKLLFKGKSLLNNKSGDLLQNKRKIAMVFQKPVVFKGTVFDNIYYGLKIRGINKKDVTPQVLDLLEQLGLKGYENQDASTLSGGESQRVALARAIIVKPEILLLDEPTANLDPLSAAKIEKFIENLKESGEIGIIIATHNLIQGQRICDRIAILNKKIFQIGTPDEIFRKPKNKFVANFVGMENVEKGTLNKTDSGLSSVNIGNNISILSSTEITEVGKTDSGYISIRPEDIIITENKIGTGRASSALNEFEGFVMSYENEGPLVKTKVAIGKRSFREIDINDINSHIFVVYLTRTSFLNLEIEIGSKIWIHFKATAVHLF
ncbi:MAG: ATP-binding cassette domain-containing protein [Methanobacteriaceae archaeon]